jgi:phosphoglucosamine mutase
LQVLAWMVMQQRTLAELNQGMLLYPQVLVNVRTQQSSHLATHPSIQALIHEIENSLNGKGRVLLRPSGTEPVLRVMVEGVEQQEVETYANTLAERLVSLNGESGN